MLFASHTKDNPSKYEKLRDYMCENKNFGRATHEKLVGVINYHLELKDLESKEEKGSGCSVGL